MKETLVTIQDVIVQRVSATITGHPNWPCRAGCDGCCRRLAAIPEISEAEWTLLSEVVCASPEIVGRILALESTLRPYICPMLDESSGRCLTYTQRPLACRTYGFYVERDQGCTAARSTFWWTAEN